MLYTTLLLYYTLKKILLHNQVRPVVFLQHLPNLSLCQAGRASKKHLVSFVFFFPFYCICRLHFGFQVSHLRKLCFGNLRNSRPLAHISTFLTQLDRFEGILKTQEYWKTLLEFLPKNKAKNESNRAKMN